MAQKSIQDLATGSAPRELAALCARSAGPADTIARRKSQVSEPRTQSAAKATQLPEQRHGDQRIRDALEGILGVVDVHARLHADPVSVAHRYVDPLDQEIVALFASSMAFGNVKAFRAKIERILDVLGPKPTLTLDAMDALAPERTLPSLGTSPSIEREVASLPIDEGLEKLTLRLAGFTHRLYRAREVAGLLLGGRRLQRHMGSLGAAFGRSLVSAERDLWPALKLFVDAIREAGGLAGMTSRGARHILADPDGGSGCKRLMLFLRWMVRGPDGVDLGLWRAHLDPAELRIPVDVHVLRLSRNLGLTTRKDAGRRSVEAITRALARFDADDPVRFDFALCHFGMVVGCPSKPAPVCDACPVKPVCRHWQT